MATRLVPAVLAAAVVALGLITVLRSAAGVVPKELKDLEGRVSELEREVGDRLAAIERRLERAGAPDAAPPGPSAALPVARAGIEDDVEGLRTRVDELAALVKGFVEGKGARGPASIASEDPDLRREAVKPLRKAAAADPQARRQLRELLDDPDPQVRAEAIRALRDLDDTESLARIAGMLEDADPAVRREAIETLGELGDAQSAASIAQHLSDPHPKVREAAAEALGALGARDQTAALVRAAQDGDEDVQREALMALGKLGDRAALEQLRDAYSQGNGDVSLRVALALRELGDPSMFDDQVKRLAEVARSSGDEKARADAVRALGRHAPEASRDVLTQALEDASPRVRKEAEKALRDGKKGK